MITKIKLMMMVIIIGIMFASCSEEAPAKMLWEVSATPTENVKAAFDPQFYEQIQITSNGEGGEATLICTNYKTLILNGAAKNEYVDADCHFTATIIEPGVIKIVLDKIPDNFQETKSLLLIV